jgi:hypothetical protein
MSECCICGEEDATLPVIFDPLHNFPGHTQRSALAHPECYDYQREGWEEFSEILAYIALDPAHNP